MTPFCHEGSGGSQDTVILLLPSLPKATATPRGDHWGLGQVEHGEKDTDSHCKLPLQPQPWLILPVLTS